MVKESKVVKKTKKDAHPFIILVIILLLASVVAYMLPAGEYDRVVMNGRTIVDPTTYHSVEREGFNFVKVMTAIPRGIHQAAGVVIITFMVGGAFGVIKKTGMLDLAVEALVKKFSTNKLGIVFVLFAVFATFTGFIGTPELVLVYIPILMPLLFKLGLDSMISVAIPLLATAAGFAAALTAPATVGIGHQIADLPMFSGMEVRIVTIAILAVTGAIYTVLYAKRILVNPKLSPVYEQDLVIKKELEEQKAEDTTPTYPRVKQAGIVTILMFLGMIVGVITQSWGFDEMSGYFILMGIIPGVIAGMSINEAVYSFTDGMRDMIVGAMVCGIARGISVVLADAFVMDTVIMYLSKIVVALPKEVGAIGMFIITTLFNGVIASGSGKAVISLPIMIPLADIAGVTRQTAILAYQMGDSLTNIVWPASGYYMAAIAIARINIKDWLKWYAPLFVIWVIICGIILYVCTLIGYGPF